MRSRSPKASSRAISRSRRGSAISMPVEQWCAENVRNWRVVQVRVPAVGDAVEADERPCLRPSLMCH